MSQLGTQNLQYDTATLIGVVPNLKKAQKFFLDTFFKGMADPETEFVAIDIDVGLRRMSPFVSPLVEGKLVEQRRMQTNTYKPAYVKDKRAPDLRKPLRRMIGERIGGGETNPQARAMANLQFEMEDQVDMLDRRLEWMAVSELLTGSVTVAGEGFDTAVIDFGRSAALTIALTSGDRWGETGVKPTDDIEVWSLAILKASGAVATDIVFDTEAWNLFKADETLKGAIYYPALGQGTNNNNINIGAQIKRGAQYKGRWGQYDLWVYNDWYIDANNVEQPMLPAYSVVISGDDMMGLRAFGVILDPRHNFASLPYAPKTWIRDDPAQQLMMMQSAPLPIPSRVNAALGATVR
jgi:hypothetical protein